MNLLTAKINLKISIFKTILQIFGTILICLKKSLIITTRKIIKRDLKISEKMQDNYSLKCVNEATLSATPLVRRNKLNVCQIQICFGAKFLLTGKNGLGSKSNLTSILPTKIKISTFMMMITLIRDHGPTSFHMTNQSPKIGWSLIIRSQESQAGGTTNWTINGEMST